ncbi:MAG TPA: ABC transporter ATP-binding protein [Ideonella sp.]|uniref:ABC transporter ATP-binding protein n=1 Tax=Ideonella sp. TaxID=1929293 RepID=UPI002E3765C7|nr:ABC transporter ATP-binding protein [Ideonella sp.]HEX5688238.1 ABC transporter ATP-binding protein [Ideonella sp.]
MAQVSLRGLRKRFGDVEVLKGIDLEVHNGEFMVFVGPSGCGKSTTLRLIAGLEELDEGDILIDGASAKDQRPAERGTAMVFQSYALYPHMTVADNLGFALKMAGVGSAERKAQVNRAAETLRITDLLKRFPRELSGGQRQRVAIGRAIVRKPRVFLFDEPLSNLDAALRVDMRIEISRLHQELGTTIIYVTHDQVEAMTMGHRIALFNKGRIEQVGAPMDLYRAPANEFVAGFIGSPRINLIDRPVAGRATAEHGALWDRLGLGVAQRAGLRPEHLAVAPNGQGVPATVELAEYLGDTTLVHLRVKGLVNLLTARADGGVSGLAAGSPVGVVPESDKAIAFDAQGCLVAC